MVQDVLIAPFKTGLDTDSSPWLSPPDSFRELNNFHVKHGYIEKRNGFRRFGYMVHAPATAITAITQANPGVVTATAHGLSNGNLVLISNVTGMTEVNGLIFTVAGVTVNTFELSGIDTTGFTAYVSGGRVALYVADRIMGIFRYIASDGSKETLAFDTTRAAVFNSVTDVFDPLDAADIMSGSDTDYIWADNWQPTGLTNRLYFTNGKALAGALDGIRYYDPVTSPGVTTSFSPSLSTTRVLHGSKLIFAFKQRLVVLHTFEKDGASATEAFRQRIRWCAIQDPANWDDTIPGGGGFADAATGEHIISARVLQNSIIVFFTNSVWQIRTFDDPADPFRWFRINDFRACDGKMATVQYDRYVVAYGVRGITATDGVETKRIDNRIEDFTSDEINVDQFAKVYCARSFDTVRQWTLYSGNLDDEETNPSNEDENTKALILDEDSLAYSQYNISMNCLGYGNFGEDFGLNDFVEANDLDLSLMDFTNETLQSYFWQENQEAFLGGSIDGIVYVLQTQGTDDGDNISCDFMTNGWNPYQAEGKECQLNYLDIYVNVDKDTQIKIEFFKDTAKAPYATRQSDILPPLDFVAIVSNITQANPAQVTAGQHGLSTGDIIFIYGVQGMVSISGEYTITVLDEDNFTLDGIDSTVFDAFTTGGQVVRKKFYRTKSWKRILAGGIGFQHRVKISSSGLNTPLKIEGLKPVFKPRGGRMIN